MAAPELFLNANILSYTFAFSRPGRRRSESRRRRPSTPGPRSSNRLTPGASEWPCVSANNPVSLSLRGNVSFQSFATDGNERVESRPLASDRRCKARHPRLPRRPRCGRSFGRFPYMWLSGSCPPNGPHFSAHPVAAEIGAFEFGEFLAVVDEPPVMDRGFGVGERERGGQERWWGRVWRRGGRLGCLPSPTSRSCRLFGRGPTISPQFPADFADPEVAGRAVEAHAPRIADAVGPDSRRAFSAGRPKGCLWEWRSCGRGRFLSTSMRRIEESKSLRSWPVSYLSGRIRFGGVAGRDVEHAVIAEVEVARRLWPPAMNVSRMRSLFTSMRGRVGSGDGELRDARTVWKLLAAFFALQDVADVTGPLFGKLRMEDEPIARVDFADVAAGVPTFDLFRQIAK